VNGPTATSVSAWPCDACVAYIAACVEARQPSFAVDTRTYKNKGKLIFTISSFKKPIKSTLFFNDSTLLL